MPPANQFAGPANPFAAPAHPYHQGVRGPVMPPPVMKPRKAPWWQREGVVSKLLVLTGGAITLIGVVMMLVIAAHAGLLSPQVRVAGGTVLALVLIGAALWIHDRPGGSIGGVALAGTGIAGLFIVTVAVTTFYEWLPVVGGLALAGVIAAASAALAMRWNSELLAVCVTVAVAALAPVLTEGVTDTLVWFLIILQVVGLAPELVKRWAWLGLVRTMPAVAVTAAYAMNVQNTAAVAASLVVLTLGVVSVLASRGADDELHSANFLTTAAPLFVLLSQVDRDVALVTGGAVALVMGAGALGLRSLTVLRRAALAAVAVVSALEACFIFTRGEWLPVLLLVPGLLVTVAGRTTKSPVAALAGVVLGGVGGAVYLTFASPEMLADAGMATAHLSIGTTLGGLVLALWAVFAGLGTLDHLPEIPRSGTIAVAGAVVLYGVTAAALSFGTAVAATPGFHSAHLGVTVIWITTAMFVLAVGLRFPQYAAATLAGGLILAGCALAKLFLFDLSMLGGATRAAAFIAVGLVMLFAGSRYAQAFARIRGEQRQPQLPVMSQH